MKNGRYCDNCETHLNECDYVSYNSWSYTCHNCGFVYRHGGADVGEQVERFKTLGKVDLFTTIDNLKKNSYNI